MKELEPHLALLRDVQSSRAAFYGLAGDLLYEPPDDRLLNELIEAFERERAPVQLETVHQLFLRAMRGGSGSPPPDATASTSCPAHISTPLLRLSVRTLFHLATNADRAARALDSGDTLEAQRAVRSGWEMLAGHVGVRLIDFALRLQGSSALFHSALGAALRELIERDLDTLEANGIHRERWLALSVNRVHRPGGRVVLESLVPCPQQNGEMVSIDFCSRCGRWKGIQYGAYDRPPMILCRPPRVSDRFRVTSPRDGGR